MKITYLAYTKQPDKSTRLSVVSYDEWKQVLAIPTVTFSGLLQNTSQSRHK